MKIKRSIAIPSQVDQWLKDLAEAQGQSISAVVSHILLKAKESERAKRKS